MPPFHVIIPARFGSSRLPGKPLMKIGDKTMIQHVVERASDSAAESVTVATDNKNVEKAVQAFGGQVVMTSPDHPSGTDRIAEAVDKLNFSEQDIIVNVQGDEPQIPPALINQVAELLTQKIDAVIATVSAPLANKAQLSDPSVVKVVTDRDGYALYFSRATIPWVRHETSSRLADNAADVVRRHLGIYAYRCGYIKLFSRRPACKLEQQEKLEQLRALWHGEKIACGFAVEIPGLGVDTLEDLERARHTLVPTMI